MQAEFPQSNLLIPNFLLKVAMLADRRCRRQSGCLLPALRAQFFLFLLLFLISGTNGLVASGTLSTSSCFAFVERYTFGKSTTETEGYFEMNVSFPVNVTNLAWLVFFSADRSWNQLLDTELSCREKVDIAKATSNVFSINSQSRVSFDSKEVYSTSRTTLYFTNKYVRRFYLGIVNTDLDCDDGMLCDGPLNDIAYTARFERRYIADSGIEESFQPSYDENILFPVYLVLTFIFIGLTIWSSCIARALFAKNKLHSIYKLLLFSIQTATIAIVCQLLHRIIFNTGINWEEWDFLPIMHLELAVKDAGYPSLYDEMRQMLPPGKGVPWLDEDSKYFFIIAEYFILFHCMLVAKGYSIVRRKLPKQGRFRLSIGMFVYLYFNVTVTAWLSATYEPKEEDWYFGMTGNACMLVLRSLMLVWFIVSVVHTRNKFLRKRRFFNKYLALVGLWIICVPLLQTILEAQLKFYERAQVYMTVQGCSLALIYGVHLFLYCPNQRCNKGFPFHANTSQMVPTDVKKETVVKFTGTDESGEEIEKIVKMKPDDFMMLRQYSVRIQERLYRLRAALDACEIEFNDLTLIDEDRMTALDFQSESEILQNDLTRGLRPMEKDSNFGRSKNHTQSTELQRELSLDVSNNEGSAKALSQIPEGEIDTTKPVDLLTGNFSRKRAGAIDTASPHERSDVRKMKKAAKKSAKISTSDPVHEAVGSEDENEEDAEETIIRRSSPKKKGKREKRSKRARKNKLIDDVTTIEDEDSGDDHEIPTSKENDSKLSKNNESILRTADDDLLPRRKKEHRGKKKKKKKKKHTRVIADDDDLD